jgi:hypothetical protein
MVTTLESWEAEGDRSEHCESADLCPPTATIRRTLNGTVLG